MHKVLQVFCHDNYKMDVRFDDGVCGSVDMSAKAFRGVFAPLQDPAFFKRATIVDGVVTWPNDADLAPDAMYAEIRQHGVWRLT